MYKAKNGSVEIGNTEMDYVTFGCGKQPLVMIPGLGDALKTVKGMAQTFSFMYRVLAKDFRVYVFSRKNRLSAGCSIRDMAEDQAFAMKQLGISGACVLGISQGGMISIHLAAEHPELVSRLVLANTAAYANETVKTVVQNWIELAGKNDFTSIFIDSTEKTYAEKKLKQYRPYYTALAAVSRPKILERFVIQAKACVKHDAVSELEKIAVPTLVVGGDCDKIVGREAAHELAEKIKNSRLHIYKELGHGAFEEAKDFYPMVREFFLS